MVRESAPRITPLEKVMAMLVAERCALEMIVVGGNGRHGGGYTLMSLGCREESVIREEELRET